MNVHHLHHTRVPTPQNVDFEAERAPAGRQYEISVAPAFPNTRRVLGCSGQVGPLAVESGPGLIKDDDDDEEIPDSNSSISNDVRF
jgi:hypothetical protein